MSDPITWEYIPSVSLDCAVHIGESALRYDGTKPADIVYILGPHPENVTIAAANVPSSDIATEKAKLGTKATFTMNDGTEITGIVARYSDAGIKGSARRNITLTLIIPHTEA